MDEANAPYGKLHLSEGISYILVPPLSLGTCMSKSSLGLYWDLLYVGTCWNNNAEVRPMSHIYEDMNAPSLAE